MSRILDALNDTLTYLDDIQAFTEGMTESTFLDDRKTQLAVIRAFEVVGEALKRVPQAVLDKEPQVDWRAVKGFRDVLIHQYDNIDMKIVWDAVRRVPEVRDAVGELATKLMSDDE